MGSSSLLGMAQAQAQGVVEGTWGFLKGVPKEELLAVVVPLVVYWVYSGFYVMLEQACPRFYASRRLHSKADERSKNLVAPGQVVRMVLLQQALQVLLVILTFTLDQRGHHHHHQGEGGAFDEASATSDAAAALPSLFVQVIQFGFACFLMDTWQYFLHRLAHENRYLYRHFHSWHHRLLVPYAYGALYNHPVEGFCLDSVGGALSFALSGMPPRNAMIFFSFATIKTVDDHCGIFHPLFPFHCLFRNNAAYHDVHHQVKGFRSNYSQPFFPFWDIVLGTYMPYTLEPRPSGGLEVRLLPPSPAPLNDCAADTAATAVAGSGAGKVQGKSTLNGCSTGESGVSFSSAGSKREGAEAAAAAGAVVSEGLRGPRVRPRRE